MLTRLTVFCALVTVAPFLYPIPQQSTKTPAQGATNSQERSESNQKPSPSPSMVNAAQTTSNDVHRRDVATDNKHQEENVISVRSLPQVTIAKETKHFLDYIFDWGPWIFNLGLVIVGGLQVKLLLDTRREIHRQADTMEGQYEDAKETGKHTETLAAQAVKQSEITQRQLDLTNRPWIAIDFIAAASDFVFRDPGEAVVTFQYQIRNVGHSVAVHLHPWIEPIVSSVHNPAEVKERISTQLRKPVNSVFDHGQLIFPGQTIVDNYPVIIRKETVDEAINKSMFKGDGDVQLACFGVELFVCFDYQSTLDPLIHHQTQGMFLLGYGDAQGGGMGVFYPNRPVYQARSLTIRYKGYGGYAD